MKLLLTSGGFTNKTIVSALQDLVEAPFSRLKLTFIPTAGNVEEGDKGWLIDDLVNCKKLGFKEVDIVDISALPKDIWEPRLRDADIIMVGGGNNYHLKYWFNKSGLTTLLSELLRTRVYVGISAGSMVTSSMLAMTQSARLYSETLGEIEGDRGLGLVDFYIRPHYNSPLFPNIRDEQLEKASKELDKDVYAIDDQSAIIVDGEEITVVSEGSWKKFT